MEKQNKLLNRDRWRGISPAAPEEGDSVTRETELAALTSQVARLFFDRQLSKKEIARRLGISRFRVARLVDQAIARGLVTIEFRDVPPQDRSVARVIEEHWGVDLCIVSRGQGPGSDPTRALARLAGSVIADLIGKGAVVGINTFGSCR